MSKKGKGVKMDWAALAVSANPDMNLPSAPDPNRCQFRILLSKNIKYVIENIF